MSRQVESKWTALVARGCVCGGADFTPCPIHSEPSDNRGLRAWFEAGMPQGFPMPATCGVCGSDGLMYPDVDLENPEKPFEHTPTLICPSCSTPYVEARLRARCEANGYAGRLNSKRVFGLGMAAVA